MDDLNPSEEPSGSGGTIFKLILALAAVLMVMAILPAVQGVTVTKNVNDAIAFITQYGGYTVFANTDLPGSAIVGVSDTQTLSNKTFTGTTVFATTNITTLNAPTGRAATYVIAAANTPAGTKNQADYICDNVSDDVQWQAALNAASALGGRQKVLAIGDFYATAQVNATNNVDLQLIGSLTVTTTNNDNAVTFNGTVNSIWDGGTYNRVGTVSIANAQYTIGQGILVWGSTNHTLVLRNMVVNNQLQGNTGSFTGVVVLTTNKNSDPYFNHVTAYGGHHGSTNGSQSNGWWLSGGVGGKTRMDDCIGYGGGGGWANGLTVEEQIEPTINNFEGYAGDFNTACYGMLFDNNAVGVVTGSTGYGSNISGGGLYGIGFWGSRPTLNSCTGIGGKRPANGTTAVGIYCGQESQPILNNCVGTAPTESYIYTYNTDNSGGFAPSVTDRPFRVVSMDIASIIGANVLLNIGTTVNGSEIASGLNISAGGGDWVEFNFSTANALAAGGSFYATPSSPTVNGTVRIYYTVMYTSNATYFYSALDLATSHPATINGGTFQSADFESSTVNIRAASVATANWKISNAFIRNYRSNSGNGAVFCNSAMTLVPIYQSTIIGVLTNVTSFAGMARNSSPNYVYENSGNATIITGNNLVTLTHGLAATPTFVSLTSSSNETGWLSWTANVTSINVTSSANVTGNRLIFWRATLGVGN